MSVKNNKAMLIKVGDIINGKEVISLPNLPHYNQYAKIQAKCIGCGFIYETTIKYFRKYNYNYCKCVPRKTRSDKIGTYLENGKKQCYKCRVIKDETEYFTDKVQKDNLKSDCKECSMKAKFKWQYDLNDEEVNFIFENKDNKCKICDKYPENTNPINARLVIDHCHKTNKFRGLICDRCNKGLGFFDDSIESLESAVNYLKGFKNEQINSLV